MPLLHDVRLDPPVGTCYFKSYKYTVPAGEDVKMEVTFYIYVTLVKPTDPDFTAKGGKVYIVATYNGPIASSSFNVDFGIEDSYGTLSGIDQLPVPGTEVKTGDTRVYTIDFTRSMSMFNNGGNSGYTFPARYKRAFSLTGFDQSRYQIYNWSLKRDLSARTQPPVMNGLQIFETNRLTKTKIKLFFTFSAIIVLRYSEEFELDFSAETMAQAVVG
ncbi:hypothetical protein APHAL10511_008196 [Amanita phalloides]|nr:hypothetical protein APHAL10511_008196 [Amanita phalloides]